MRTHFLAIGFLLSGCMVAVSPENAPEKSIVELCQVIHWKGNGFDYGADAAFSELVSRRVFSTRDMAAISSGVPYVGMSENAARCAVGFFDEQNTTITSGGTSKQHVIGDFPYVWYFYTRNGIVTGVQV